jgi:hypothetical protein
MPDVTLSTDEMRDCAMACRVANALAERDAANQDNPRIKQTLSETAQRYLTLAGKFERARKG